MEEKSIVKLNKIIVGVKLWNGNEDTTGLIVKTCARMIRGLNKKELVYLLLNWHLLQYKGEPLILDNFRLERFVDLAINDYL